MSHPLAPPDRGRQRSPRRTPAGRIHLAAAASLALCLLVTAVSAWLRCNTSPSLPPGLYLLRHSPPTRGGLVLLCPPLGAALLARSRGYLAAGSCPGGSRALGKVLLAGAGELVVATPAGVVSQGRLLPGSRPLTRDPSGRPLSHFPFGPHLLRPGEIWLYAPHPLSYDSRYFGPVRLAAVQGVLKPLLTWRAGFPRRLGPSLPSAGARRRAGNPIGPVAADAGTRSRRLPSRLATVP